MQLFKSAPGVFAIVLLVLFFVSYGMPAAQNIRSKLQILPGATESAAQKKAAEDSPEEFQAVRKASPRQ